MPKYFLSVIDDTNHPATPESGTASDAEAAAIDVFNEKLLSNGHWIYAAGLGGPASATVIDNRAGAGLVTDGPFAETKEFVAGFWLIEAADRDEALVLATEGSLACNRKVEVRAFLEPPA